MNSHQQLWWEQTHSDYLLLLLLRRNDVIACHQLHYLQMITEKLGKAYFWRDGKALKKSHAFFANFLKALNNRSDPDRSRIAKLLGFQSATAFETFLSKVAPLAHELERLAPALAGNSGPNPEYPWPMESPIHTPVSFEFEIWVKLTGSAIGRQLLKVIDNAVIKFPEYG